MWSSKVQRHFLLCSGRNISSTVAVNSNTNHYNVLGITPKATQAEVKNAYYKLSKLHHPDRSFNKENGENGEKFRLISEAYEVLGNYRSRQLYDKGLYGHSRRFEENKKKGSEPDHPKMSFYKSRFDKSRVPSEQMKGIYDFDEWTRQHYSETFAKTQAATKFTRKGDPSAHPKHSLVDDTVLKVSFAAILAALGGVMLMEFSSIHYDSPRQFNEVSDKPT